MFSMKLVLGQVLAIFIGSGENYELTHWRAIVEQEHGAAALTRAAHAQRYGGKYEQSKSDLASELGGNLLMRRGSAHHAHSALPAFRERSGPLELVTHPNQAWRFTRTGCSVLGAWRPGNSKDTASQSGYHNTLAGQVS